MRFYASPTEEKGALRRAAARAGCHVAAVDIRAMGDVGGRAHAVGRVECADGWAAARLVLALAIEDSDTDGARELAAQLRRRARGDRAFVELVQRFVRERIEFRRDEGEIFSGPDYAFELGYGDCEDQTRAVYAILRAAGVPVRMAFLHRGGPPTHAVAQASIDGEVTWIETTIAAELGEHPNAAAQRLELADDRTDLAEEVRIMSEKVLAPIPAGFRAANDATQVERDAQALERLGFLTPCAQRRSGDPSDLVFRRAVIAFQEKSGIVADGLIGPQTRRTISGALPHDEFGMGYVGALAPAKNERMAWAWPIMFEAARELALDVSPDALAIAMAIAKLETNYGDPKSWGDSHNWGAVTFNARRGEPYTLWGDLPHGDKDANGRPVTYRFQRYPTDLEGAKDALRVKLSGGTRGAAGRAAIRAAFLAADVDGVAGAMYRNGYYTGIAGTAEDRIAAYAGAIRAHLPAVRAAAPEGVTFGKGGELGKWGGLALLALSVGGALWLNR